jgi:casein kinase II subunit alpha
LFFTYKNLRYSRKAWQKFITPENKHLCDDNAIDLLSKMLVYDHAERITPKDAMEHSYFAPLRNNKL